MTKKSYTRQLEDQIKNLSSELKIQNDAIESLFKRCHLYHDMKNQIEDLKIEIEHLSDLKEVEKEMINDIKR